VLAALLLCVVGRLGPDPALQVKVSPLSLERLAQAGPCEKLRPDGVAGPLVRVLIQHAAEPAQLLVREPAIALLLIIAL